jgi:hypothetical protein
VDVNKIYHSAPWHFTADGGKTWHGSAGDTHALWIDPSNPKHAIHGVDGGVTEYWNAGDLLEAPTRKLYLPPTLQMYAVGYDMRKLYHVMGAGQDFEAYSVPTQGRYGGVTVFDGDDLNTAADGCKVMADPEDWRTVYAMGAGPSLSRVDVQAGSLTDITPFKQWNADADAYTEPRTYETYRNSNPRLRTTSIATFLISPWNAKTIYYAANYLMKSVDRGDHWTIISPDLTHDRPEWQIPQRDYYHEGNERFGNNFIVLYQGIRTISESPLKQGMLWVGTDDGNVQLTMDDGAHWTNLTKNFQGVPEYTWVSHIDASHFSEGRAYVTFDGHRGFDLTTYVFMTDDYGKTWTKITANLPEKESAYVITEGRHNPDLLFLGTEFSLWVSMDRGTSWSRYQDWEVGDRKGYFPTVAVHDLEIHPRELDLIIGTHGRSIWTVPVRALEELTVENRAKDVYFVSPRNVYLFRRWLSERQVDGFNHGRGPMGIALNTQPGTSFYYHLKQAVPGGATITITDLLGQEVYASFKGVAHAGLNVIPWLPGSRGQLVPPPQLGKRPTPMAAGDYRAVLTVDGKEYVRVLHVEDVSSEAQ